MKDKEGLRNYYRLEKTKEKQKLMQCGILEQKKRA